jgi:U11/U12 small nuclear ribonucleoprotein SNRNP25
MSIKFVWKKSNNNKHHLLAESKKKKDIIEGDDGRSTSTSIRRPEAVEANHSSLSSAFIPEAAPSTSTAEGLLDTLYKKSTDQGLISAAVEPPLEIPSAFPDFVKLIDSEIDGLLRDDPLLGDLHGQHLTSESVQALLAFETGPGIRVYLKREDGSSLRIDIKKSETVGGLKKRIQTETERELSIQQEGRVPKISWKYVWRSNVIGFEGTKLTDDQARLKDVGITNHSEISFVKKLRDKKKGLGKKKKKKAKLSRDSSGVTEEDDIPMVK